MLRVIEECQRLGKRQMLAVIGDSANAASIGLHSALGFGASAYSRTSGTSSAAGWTLCSCSARFETRWRQLAMLAAQPFRPWTSARCFTRRAPRAMQRTPQSSQQPVTSAFVTIVGLPASVPHGARGAGGSAAHIRLEQSVLQRLWRRKFAPQNPNVYRGWFPVQPGNLTSKEGIDLGADVAYGAAVIDARDPLREPTPLPAESLLPGWHSAIAAYYTGDGSRLRCAHAVDRAQPGT
jgi:hypothetical protein